MGVVVDQRQSSDGAIALPRLAAENGQKNIHAALAAAIGDRSAPIWEFLKYFAASVVALAVDWGLLVVLTEIAGLNYLASAPVGYSIGLIVGYVLSVTLVFDRRRIADARREFVLFALIGLVGLALNQFVLFGAVDIVGLNYAVAKGPAAAIGFFFNFLVRRALLFSGKHTAARPARRHAPLPTWPSESLLWGASATVSAASIWVLSRCNEGLVRDARIYIGRALADLDPNGIGRDLMFANDGQSGFSLFPFVADRLVGALGASGASMAFTLAAITFWFVGIASVARRFASGRLLWTILIFVAVLPIAYGAYDAFRAGEALAVPRPFAEAGVLASLASLAEGRFASTILLLVVASLIHPIMALGGIAVAIAVKCYEDWRWGVIPVLAALAVPLAAILGLPIAGRLFSPIDVVWRGVLDVRAPYLFPSLWPAAAWVGVFVQMATIVIAASFVNGRVRTILIASIVVVLAGLSASIVLGDWAGSLLIVQVQPWRAQWLTAVLGTATLALAIVNLCRREPTDQMIAALLASAWVPGVLPGIAVSAAGVALLLHVRRRSFAVWITPRAAKILWFAAATGAIWASLPAARLLGMLLASKPSDLPLDFALVSRFGVHVLPICVLTAFWALVRRRPSSPALTASVVVTTAALVLAAILLWDTRSPMQRLIDNGDKSTGLPNLLADRPGEVLWLNGDVEAWQLAHRSNWAAMLQGASTVYSRPLALQWEARARRLIALGFATVSMHAPFTEPEPPTQPTLPSKVNLQLFCQASDAPAWIVTSVARGAAWPADLMATIWSAPVPSYSLSVEEERLVWRGTDTYALVPCAHSDPLAGSPAQP